MDPHRYAPDEARYRGGDHRWLDELDAVAVHAGPPHQRMGTRVVAEDDWLRVDEHRSPELALRRRLVGDGHDEVFGALPGSGAAAEETAALVDGWLAVHRPGAGDEPEGGEPGHPLLQAGLRVQEDLCLMQRDEAGAWRLTAALLCFPTFWRLHDKLGSTQQDVHGPVPHYAEDLAGRVTRFFDRLAPGRIVARRNWGFAAHPLLFVPDLDAVRHDEVFSPERLWLRSERQTLRRLPGSGAVLFTIRVQLAPAEAVAARPELARRLADAMAGWSPELVAARSARHGWYGEVSAWLTAVAAGIDR